MHELVINLHMHTTYSDGHGSHGDIAEAALQAGLDAVVVTDHNVWVKGPEGYYEQDDRRVLMLIGEEIHDQARDPQKNHLLVIGADRELAPLAYDTQRLLNEVRKSGGVAFAAHPFDPAAPAVGETDIGWVDWDVQGLHGLEIWNEMSEFKSLLETKLHAVFYAYNPRRISSGADWQTLAKWDDLLRGGRRLAAIGGSDAHAMLARLGPLRRILFPYRFLFQTINTHLLVPEPLSGEIEMDKRLILDALGRGRAFVGYDLPAPTRGFRFTAQGLNQSVSMGEEVSAVNGVTLQVRLPRKTECRLLCSGKEVRTWQDTEICTYITTQPGVYRVEVYLEYLGKRRGWIYSNPIYVTS